MLSYATFWIAHANKLFCKLTRAVSHMLMLVDKLKYVNPNKPVV